MEVCVSMCEGVGGGQPGVEVCVRGGGRGGADWSRSMCVSMCEGVGAGGGSLVWKYSCAHVWVCVCVCVYVCRDSPLSTRVPPPSSSPPPPHLAASAYGRTWYRLTCAFSPPPPHLAASAYGRTWYRLTCAFSPSYIPL